MTLTDDTFYELLGNERRRACLEQLIESETEWSVSDLARAVATEVTDPSTSPEDIYDSVYISLCQNHLPKLDEVSLIEYNRDAKTVTTGPEFDEIARRLRPTQHTGSPKSTRVRSMGTSAVTVVLIVAVAVSSTLARYLLAVVLVLHLGVIAVLVLRQLRSQSE